MRSYDVAIVGGGLAGLTQALLLSREGFHVACIDREAPVTQLSKGYDTRTTAISWGSRNVLRQAGVWSFMEDGRACPIRDIKILDGESPFTLSFLSREVEDREFGWIVDNHDLRYILHKSASEAENIDHLTGDAVKMFHVKQDGVTVQMESGQELFSKLVLGCDGRRSATREFMGIGTWGHSYDQTAIVCLVDHELPHEHTALEHFLPEGPFASLPMWDEQGGQKRSAVVWSIHGANASQFVNCTDAAFNKHLQRLYKGRFGNVKLSGARAAWPLNIKMAYEYTGSRMVLMAEAAHGIHPIAGQGLNLSLRDCASMTEILVDARNRGIEDWGAADLLAKYQKCRRLDNAMMGLSMEGFNGLFSNNLAPLKFARQAGLRIISKMPAFKRFFMTQAMGTVGHVPEMVKKDTGRNSNQTSAKG